jgi:hypothetical protein
MPDLYADEEDRDAIRKAYYGLAHGDPKTFPVQVSVLLTAHAQALKAYQRPDLTSERLKSTRRDWLLRSTRSLSGAKASPEILRSSKA